MKINKQKLDEKKMDDTFYRIKQAYQSSVIDEIQKRVYNFKYMYIVVALSLCLVSSLLTLIHNSLSIVGILLIGYSLFIFRKQENNFFYNQFNVKESFLKDNKQYRMGERALLFFDKIRVFSFDNQKIQEQLDIEIECKIFNIWNIPYVLAALSVFGIVLKQFVSLQEIKPFLWHMTFAAAIIAYLVCLYFEIFRTKEAKMKELKLFLYWYDLFGKSTIKNSYNYLNKC